MPLFRVLKAAAVGAALGCFSTSIYALDPARGASQYRFQEWLPSEGLPYPAVRGIAQDPSGYIWFATREGVARFDGLSITAYSRESAPELKYPGAHCFVPDSDGSLLIGMEREILRYKGGKWFPAPEFNMGKDLSVRALSKLPNGDLLIGTRNQLYLHRSSGTEKVELQGGEKIAAVNRMIALRSGAVVISARPLTLFRDGKAEVFPVAGGLVDMEIICAEEDPEEGLWIGTTRGLHRIKDGTVTNYTVKDGLPVNIIRSLLFDRDGNLWIGTPSGLTRFQNGRFENVVINGIEKLSHVLDLFEDREGNLWGGTDNGFFKMSDAPFANLTQRDGLQASSVFGVLPTSDGSVWIATWGGGLGRYRDGIVRSYRVDDGLVEDGILALSEDPQKRIWFSYYTRGIGCFDGSTFHQYGKAQGAGERFVRVAATSEGDIWAMEELGGLKKLNEGVFQPVPDLPLTHPRALSVASDGSIWVGGDEGAAQWKHGAWKLYPNGRRASELTQTFIEDGRGGMWLLRDGCRLELYGQGEAKILRLPSTLGPLAYGATLLGDEMWLSLRFGVVRVRVANLYESLNGKQDALTFAVYDESTGMRSRAPNSAGAPVVSLVNGTSVWVATSKGVAMISPSRVRQSSSPPIVAIEDVLVDKRALDLSRPLRLPAAVREMEIRFTALSHSNPEQLVFKYRLRGSSEDWSEASRGRTAYFGGLPAGTYNFEVMARNAEGLWSAEPASISIELPRHLHEHWWFRVAAGLAFLLLCAAIYAWRVQRVNRRARRLQEQNLQLEQRIASRTAELARSNEAVKASEYFYHSLIESLPQIILRKDVDGRIQYVNTAFCELMRRPIEEILGKVDYDLCAPELAAKLRADDERVLKTGEVMEHEHYVDRPGEPRRYLHCKRVPLWDKDGKPIGIQVIFWDMTRFRETEERLKQAQNELAETSRLAGIAEMATGVLHNIGNALNSVNTSAAVVADSIRAMKLNGVTRAAEMLKSNQEQLPVFLSEDPKGRQLPEYLHVLSSHLEADRGNVLQEIKQLELSVAHIKEIVVAQQSHAKVSGFLEVVSAAELLEFSLRICETALKKQAVVVSREFMPTPPVRVPKQKVMQILVNLVRNAADSLKESHREDKRLIVGVRLSDEGQVEIRITDNGVGISPENLTRIFAFGFTTKKSGHGFGLHSSALAAREMNGSLTATSAGVGRGASFFLALPTADEASVRNATRPPIPIPGGM